MSTLTLPLDVACPKCEVPPGFPCDIGDQLGMTPRQVARGVENQHHTARVRAAAQHNQRMSKKRGYSREFKPHGDTGKRYLLDDIPAGLWRGVRDKAKRRGVSVRALILTLLEKWVNDEAADS